MANRSKQKGDRAERAIVELLRSAGLNAYRVPLSGAVNGFMSDVEIRFQNETLKIESKARSKGFSRIYTWLLGNDAVVVKADYNEPLIFMRLEQWAKLLGQIRHNQAQTTTDKASSGNPSQSQPETSYSTTDYVNVVPMPHQSYDVVINSARLKPL